MNRDYLGDGIQEYILLNYRMPVLTLGYDVIIGDEEKMIYISIFVDADGNLQKIEGISSHSTGNLVEDQIWEEPLYGGNIIIFTGTVTFTGDGSIAVYKDDNYTLTISFLLPYQIDVTRYKPMEGGTYLCNSVPGYEAS